MTNKMAYESLELKKIVTEYYAKCLQVILESRIPSFASSIPHSEDTSSSSATEPGAKGCWFNLVLGQCGHGLEKLDPWRRGTLEPMVIDILFQQSKSQGTIVLERWVIQFAGHSLDGMTKAKKGGACLQIPMHALELPAVYKRTLIMLRSLYCTARLLPAHTLFRLACCSNRCNFTLSYRIWASNVPCLELGEPDMTMYNFAPVESHRGQICLSVAYRHKVPVAAVETSSPIHPQIIPDYVGSSAIDPLKRVSNDWDFGGPTEKREMRLMSVPELPPSRCQGGRWQNKAQLSCMAMAARDENGDFIMVPSSEDHVSRLLPPVSLIKSGKHFDAEDEELVCPFAIDEHYHRMDSPKFDTLESDFSGEYGAISHNRSKDAVLGTIMRMLKGAAPLRCAQAYPSIVKPRLPSTCQEQTSSPPVPVFDISIQPEGDIKRQLKKTTTDALEELKMYKRVRDSLLK